MRKILTLITFFVVFTMSCKTNEDPIGYIGNAEFFASGKINNQPFLMEAGNNNFVMETSNSKDTLNINYYTGTLKNTCNNCNENLSISIRNYEVGNSANWQVDSVFRNDRILQFFKEILPPSSFRVIFKNESKGLGNVDYTWDFGNGFGSLSENPSFVFTNQGKQNITLLANYKDVNCNSNIQNPIYINPNDLNNNINFTYQNIGNNIFRCTVINADSNTHRFVWKYQNQTTSFPVGKTFDLPAYTLEGVYKVDLLAINKTNNDTVFVSKNLATLATTDCSANFSYTIQPVRDTLQLNKVIVDYTDKNGVLYSSKNIEQFTAFVIQEVSNYKNPQSGKKTVKVKVLFTCKVSNGAQTLELNNVNGIFAFSY